MPELQIRRDAYEEFIVVPLRTVVEVATGHVLDSRFDARAYDSVGRFFGTHTRSAAVVELRRQQPLLIAAIEDRYRRLNWPLPGDVYSADVNDGHLDDLGMIFGGAVRFNRSLSALTERTFPMRAFVQVLLNHALAGGIDDYERLVTHLLGSDSTAHRHLNARRLLEQQLPSLCALVQARLRPLPYPLTLNAADEAAFLAPITDNFGFEVIVLGSGAVPRHYVDPSARSAPTPHTVVYEMIVLANEPVADPEDQFVIGRL